MNIPPLVYIAAVSVALPFIFGIFHFFRLPSDLKPLVVLFGAHAAITVAQFALAFQGVNNLWTSHVYNIIEVVFLLIILSTWASGGKSRLLMRSTAILYVLFWVFAKVFLEKFNAPAVYTPTISRIIIISGTLYLLVVVASQTHTPIFREPKFWFAAGFLLACAGSLMFYGFRTLLDGLSMDAIVRVWSIHWVVLTVSNILLTIGFLCRPQARNSGGQLELAQ